MLDIELFKKKFDDEKWWLKLKDFFKTSDAYDIYQYLKKRSKEGNIILPDSSLTFNAFNKCKFDDLKIICLGMEPYSSVLNKVKVADGMSFSCSNTIIPQPSLEYLWYSIKNNFPKQEIIETNDLSWLSEQGILFLNYSLTTEKGITGAHLSLDEHVFKYKNLWESFIKYLFEESLRSSIGIVYILFGKDAKKAKRYINPLGNYILETDHPSFAARNKNKDWKADNVWLKSNRIIESCNGEFYKINYNQKTYLENKEIVKKSLSEMTDQEINDLPIPF